MISLIVQLLIAFPKIGALLLKLKREYVKEIVTRRDNEHRNNIAEWVRDAKREQDSRVPKGTEQPRV
jgi:hypothetical protein